MKNNKKIHLKEYFISFLIGMVAANLLFYTLPEIFEDAEISKSLISISFVTGLGMQYFLHSFLSPVKKTGDQFLIFLHIHNITDGLTIGLAFLVSVAFGIFMIFAVMIHDIIHKLIGFSFLRAQGDAVRTAVIKITTTFVSIIAGAILMLTIKLSDEAGIIGGAFAAGSLLYIVFLLLGEVFGKTVIIPHHYAKIKIFKAGFFLLGGILMIGLFVLFETIMPHGH